MPSVASLRALAPLMRCWGALFCLLLCACARPAPTDQKMPVSFLPAPGDLLTSAGDRLAPEAFRKRSQSAAYILIGESHGNPCDHEAERRILNILAHNPAPPAVGLEMVPQSFSPVLDAYLAGTLAEGELEARLDWRRTWGHPFQRYLPVFQTLREWKLPAAGLNVPPEVIRRLSAAALNNATAADPVASLSPEDRAWLPKKIIGPAPEQLEFLREVMLQHPAPGGGDKSREAADPRQVARFQLIQSVWDTGMAEQAVRLRERTGRPVAILAGAAHVEGGLGIARRLKALDPGATILLVSPWRGQDFDPSDSPGADLRVYCPEVFVSRMGMTLETRPFGEEFQVVVSEVARESRADLSGLRPGDVVTRAGGFRMRSMNALHLAGSDAYRDKKPLVLEVRRGDQCYSVDLGPLGVQNATPGAKPDGAK